MAGQNGNSPNVRQQLLAQMPKNAICAEIGVWEGMFSRMIMHSTSPRMLHLIDPWEFQPEFPERMYGGSVAKSQKDMDAIHDNVMRAFSGLQNVAIHRNKSQEILSSFREHYFDWVYIDGNHYYEYVRLDLELCYTKVKPGGKISGDDWTWGETEDYPVRRAVHDFVNEKNLKTRLKILGSQFIIEL